MNAIVAADINWGIGREGKLLAYLPEDLKYFRRMTVGKTVIMGRKTLESLPGARPLKDRKNIVLTKDLDYRAGDALVCHSREDVLEAVGPDGMEDAFVIGGGSVYAQFLADCTAAYVTRIRQDLSPDTYFPDLDKDPGWELLSAGDENIYNGIIFQYCIYRRKKKARNEYAVM